MLSGCSHGLKALGLVHREAMMLRTRLASRRRRLDALRGALALAAGHPGDARARIEDRGEVLCRMAQPIQLTGLAAA